MDWGVITGVAGLARAEEISFRRYGLDFKALTGKSLIRSSAEFSGSGLYR
jgi:hypothetical protein